MTKFLEPILAKSPKKSEVMVSPVDCLILFEVVRGGDCRATEELITAEVRTRH